MKATQSKRGNANHQPRALNSRHAGETCVLADQKQPAHWRMQKQKTREGACGGVVAHLPLPPALRQHNGAHLASTPT